MIVLPPKKNTPEKQVELLAVNSKDAATMLAVSERTIFNLAKAKRISCKKIGWRSVFSVASLKAFLESTDAE